jgi:hypothetical protein
VPKAFARPDLFEQEVGPLEKQLRFCRAADQALGDLAVIDRHPADERLPLLSAVQRALAQRKDLNRAAAAAEKLASLAKKPDEVYAAACAVALCVPLAGKDDARDKLATRAVELLRQAIAGGYEESARLKKDPDLDPLRHRADFKKLLAD